MSRTKLHHKYSLSYVPYKVALLHMQDYVTKIIEGEAAPCLWFLEHPPLYTAGMSAQLKDVLQHDIAPVYKTNRGGQVTYHGPGQQIVYVMMPLDPFKKDVRAYVKFLEEWVILTLAEFGVEGFRMNGKIGIWVKDKGQIKKIAALGVRVKRWVAYHGIALNNTVDLKAYRAIIPCGINDFGVTSLAELGVEVSEKELQARLKGCFTELFLGK